MKSPLSRFSALCFIALSTLAALIPGLSVHAQNSPENTSQQKNARAAPDMRTSEVLGKEVKNAQGEDLGDIENLVVDIDNERVRYAVMSLDEFFGRDDKLFAIPLNQFRVDDKGNLMLNVAKAELEKAPGLMRNRSPNFSEETYRTAVDRYFFKEELTRHTPSGARLVDADDLIGKEINDRAGNDAGEIEDLVVNFGDGRAYAVMKVDKAWSPDEKLVAMPFAAFMVPSRSDLDLALKVDRPRVEAARGFKDDEWPDLNAVAVRRDIASQLAAFQNASKASPQATQSGRESASGASQ